MGVNFVSLDRHTPMMFPPDLRDWVPEDSIVHLEQCGSSLYLWRRIASRS